MQKFLALIEDQFQCKPPLWWCRVATDFNSRSEKKLGQREQNEDYADEAARGVSQEAAFVNGTAGMTKIVVGLESIQVESLGLNKTKVPRDLAAVRHRNECSFLALHDERASSYALLRVDAMTNRVQWSADVWAGGGKYGYEGHGYHKSQVLPLSKSVVVFGAGDDCIYAESFDIERGIPLVRFSTGY